MAVQIEFKEKMSHSCAAFAIGMYENGALSGEAAALDQRENGVLSRLISHAKFTGKQNKTCHFLLPIDSELKGRVMHIFMVGLGDPKKMTPEDAQNAGGSLFPLLKTHKVSALTLSVDEESGPLSPGMLVGYVAHGISLRSWVFQKYVTKKPKQEEIIVVDAISRHMAESADFYHDLEAVAEGVFAARDVVTEPPNVLNPEAFAMRAKSLEKHGLKVEILKESQLQKLGMGALLGVGQGSVNDSYVAIMRWNGGEKDAAPVAFVGKGVCFDSGGISIKPSRNMEDMKFDMGGAAAVYGVMKTLGLRKAKVNAVGVIGLVENMPSGSAIRPSDILTSMSGQTIEVLNTDAEGRLVLADVLWYTKETFKPKIMVDLATLTGAILVSFADVHTGLFSNDDMLSGHLVDSGLITGENVWRMPLSDKYDAMITSPIADVANISTSGVGAGSITAAQFLKKFVGDTPWAHLDIAGTVWSKVPKPLSAKGATGVGVRLLNQMVKKYYEA